MKKYDYKIRVVNDIISISVISPYDLQDYYYVYGNYIYRYNKMYYVLKEQDDVIEILETYNNKLKKEIVKN